jgi:hypothetical protein
MMMIIDQYHRQRQQLEIRAAAEGGAPAVRARRRRTTTTTTEVVRRKKRLTCCPCLAGDADDVLGHERREGGRLLIRNRSSVRAKPATSKLVSTGKCSTRYEPLDLLLRDVDASHIPRVNPNRPFRGRAFEERPVVLVVPLLSRLSISTLDRSSTSSGWASPRLRGRPAVSIGRKATPGADSTHRSPRSHRPSTRVALQLNSFRASYCNNDSEPDIECRLTVKCEVPRI